MYMFLTIILAFCLDLIFGDPKAIKHPICYIGALISKTELFLRKRVKSELFGGVLLIIIVCTVCFITPFAMLFVLNKISLVLAFILEVFWGFQIFATKSLRVESMKVYSALKNEDINSARKYLSYIVGRDTKYLDEKSIIKATVETVAENTTDGVVAPLFFMGIGGVPFSFLYKGINTMDSMVGYKNEKYILFGRAAAYLDDIANFVPARFTALVMMCASFFCGLNTKNAFVIYKRDRKKHKSPNSAQTESVCAGALGVQLAGDAFYFGKKVEKPTIGDNIRDITAEDIKTANKLMTITSIISAIMVCAVHLLIYEISGSFL